MDMRDIATANGTIAVRIRLFARYSEVTDTESVSLELRAGATVADAVRQLRARIPNGNLLPERPLAAVNLEHVLADRRLSDGDELALLPPLAGG
jgi:sulfur-carrier protein